jgi:hypothetical protein
MTPVDIRDEFGARAGRDTLLGVFATADDAKAAAERKPMRILLCRQCRERFDATYNSQKICSDECRAERKRMTVNPGGRRRKRTGDRPDLNQWWRLRSTDWHE